ncbi:MAG: DNA polymerase IV [Gammaproteobacteria bacterium]|nr:DNA polymerase IV [Gammaproteobacteria bacterium]
MDPWPRIVVHADMDAFYAAVEQLDDPGLRGKPVLVGPKSRRGVVLTASYEARPYGVGSAMPMGAALRRCPDAIIVGPRFDRYQEVSSRVMDILADFSPRVEALSMDEAFVDMTGAERLFGTPRQMGSKIRQAVREATRLNISVGIASTKYVAKVASAESKPDGLMVVPADRAKAWLAPLSVSRLWGAGRKTVPRLQALGLSTIGDVAAADATTLARLGGLGAHFHALANARDPRGVRRTRVAKSIGSDRTLVADISRREDIELHLRRAADRIGRRLRAKRYAARGVRVRLKTHRFQVLTRQRKLRKPVDLGAELMAAGISLLGQFNDPGPFRLVGMAAFDLVEREGPRQLDLFEDLAARELETTVDGLMHRFGRGVLMRARDLADWGTVAADGVNLDYLDNQM